MGQTASVAPPAGAAEGIPGGKSSHQSTLPTLPSSSAGTRDMPRDRHMVELSSASASGASSSVNIVAPLTPADAIPALFTTIRNNSVDTKNDVPAAPAVIISARVDGQQPHLHTEEDDDNSRMQSCPAAFRSAAAASNPFLPSSASALGGQPNSAVRLLLPQQPSPRRPLVIATRRPEQGLGSGPRSFFVPASIPVPPKVPRFPERDEED
jgi:hypothetical protein